MMLGAVTVRSPPRRRTRFLKTQLLRVSAPENLGQEGTSSLSPPTRKRPVGVLTRGGLCWHASSQPAGKHDPVINMLYIITRNPPPPPRFNPLAAIRQFKAERCQEVKRVSFSVSTGAYMVEAVMVGGSCEWFVQRFYSINVQHDNDVE